MDSSSFKMRAYTIRVPGISGYRSPFSFDQPVRDIFRPARLSLLASGGSRSNRDSTSPISACEACEASIDIAFQGTGPLANAAEPFRSVMPSFVVSFVRRLWDFSIRDNLFYYPYCSLSHPFSYL